MNNNETRTLWISLGTALFAVFLLYSWSQERKAAMHREFGSSEQVVVAVKDIPEMTPIDESMLDVVSRPVDFIEPSAISTPDMAVGQLAAAPIKKGEQILDTKLLLPGKTTGLAMEISPGKRAFTIPVDDVRGVARLIKPGDRIDLVAALDVGKGQNTRKEVRTLMQDVVVLATGEHIANQLPISVQQDRGGNFNIENLRVNNKFSTLTIEVKPDEVQDLVYILATSPGSLFVALRNSTDRYMNTLGSTGVEDIVRTAPSPRVPASAEVNRPAPAPKPAPRSRAPAPKSSRGGFKEI